jgi:hypothetical protein
MVWYVKKPILCFVRQKNLFQLLTKPASSASVKKKQIDAFVRRKNNPLTPDSPVLLNRWLT